MNGYDDKRGFSGACSYVCCGHIKLVKWNKMIGMNNPKNIERKNNWVGGGVV